MKCQSSQLLGRNSRGFCISEFSSDIWRNQVFIEIGFIKEDSREQWWEGRIDTDALLMLEYIKKPVMLDASEALL